MVATICHKPGTDSSSSAPLAAPVDERIANLGKLARQALFAEADLTPKPALVDRRGSGAHDDLSLKTMHRSALTLEPYFRQMAETSANSVPLPAVFEQLQGIGRAAELAMLRATNGSNAHKGAIWTLGLLVAAASMQASSNRSSLDLAAEIAATAGSIASFQDSTIAEPKTHGFLVRQRFAVLGARGEAQQAFPHVVALGLPALRRRRAEGANETVARLDCLLSIMSELDDTCLLYRGGASALLTAQIGAMSALEAGGAGSKHGLSKLQDLDQQLLKLNCSPGGSADLLAATLFLDAMERGESDVWDETNILNSKLDKEA